MKKLALACLLIAAPLAAQARELAPRTCLTYDVITPLGTAHATESLEIAGGRYVLTSRAQATGVLALVYRGAIERTSRGTVGKPGLRPLEFEDKRPGRDTARAEFDWDAKKLKLSRGDERDELDLPPDTQDRLSVFWHFTLAPPAGKLVELHETDGRHLSRYRYAVVGTETLQTPAGKLETVRLSKQLDRDEKRQREIWLATEHNHVPVRVLVTEPDGSKADQVVTRLTCDADK